jgi:hypothetical protein
MWFSVIAAAGLTLGVWASAQKARRADEQRFVDELVDIVNGSAQRGPVETQKRIDKLQQRIKVNAKVRPSDPAIQRFLLRVELKTARMMLETDQTYLQFLHEELALPPERRLPKVNPQRIQELKDAIAQDTRRIKELKQEIAKQEAKEK